MINTYYIIYLLYFILREIQLCGCSSVQQYTPEASLFMQTN